MSKEQIPAEVWEAAAKVYVPGVKGGWERPARIIEDAGYTVTKGQIQKRMERMGVAAASRLPQGDAALPMTRRCRNKHCINRFVPVNSNHFYCTPECQQSPELWSVEEILQEEGSLFPEASHLEMAKRAFGQKNQAVRKVTALQSMRDFMAYELRELAKENPQLIYPARPVTPPEKDRKERVVVVMLSDWQIGKLEDGIGVKEMQENRIPRIKAAVRSIVQHFRDAGYAVNKLIYEFGGDMIENCYIFGGQQITGLDRTANTHRVTRQSYLATSIMADVVMDGASYVAEVEVLSVPGNHGRTNGKNDFSDPNDNFDTMVAWFARDRTQAQKNVTWRIQDEDWHTSFDVLGHTFVTQHGDAWMGDFAKLEKLLPQWVLGNIFGARPDVFLTHHRHSFAVMEVNGVTCVQNGTIDGGSLWYTKKYGKMSRPNQTVIIASEKRPTEAIYPIVF